ncbi:unnamed protein product [Caretta caretta]
MKTWCFGVAVGLVPPVMPGVCRAIWGMALAPPVVGVHSVVRGAALALPATRSRAAMRGGALIPLGTETYWTGGEAALSRLSMEICLAICKGETGLLLARTWVMFPEAAGFPISKPNMNSWMKRGEELHVPNLQGYEEEAIISDTHTGDGTVSENSEKSLQQEGPEQMSPHGMLWGRSEGNVSQNPEQRETCESQHRPDRQQGNHPGEGHGKSTHRSRVVKRNKETDQQRIHDQEGAYTCSDCGKSFQWRSVLILHHRINTGKKPFNCCDCRKNFNENSNLIIHQGIHTTENL